MAKNPEHTRRRPESHNPDGGQGITVIDADLPDPGLEQAFREIEGLRNSPRESVMVLERYRNSRNVLGRQKWRMPKVELSTVHGTKGGRPITLWRWIWRTTDMGSRVVSQCESS